MPTWRQKQKNKIKEEAITTRYVSIGKVKKQPVAKKYFEPPKVVKKIKPYLSHKGLSIFSGIVDFLLQKNYHFFLFLAISLISLTGVVHAGVSTFNNSRRAVLPESFNVSNANILGIQAVDSTYIPPSSGFQTVDIREYVFNEYFKVRNSPLQGLGHLFTEACDRYGAPRDCLTTVAIARHETDLCKYSNSAEMHNCMGWGGAGPNRRSFPDFKSHIDTATDVLVNQYGAQYMIDPRLMERVFCGPQAECDNWGNRILYFMEEIDRFAEELGVGRLSALR